MLGKTGWQIYISSDTKLQHDFVKITSVNADVCSHDWNSMNIWTLFWPVQASTSAAIDLSRIFGSNIQTTNLRSVKMFADVTPERPRSSWIFSLKYKWHWCLYFSECMAGWTLVLGALSSLRRISTPRRTRRRSTTRWEGGEQTRRRLLTSWRAEATHNVNKYARNTTVHTRTE